MLQQFQDVESYTFLTAVLCSVVLLALIRVTFLIINLCIRNQDNDIFNSKAYSKAKCLFAENLTSEQRETFVNAWYILVKGSDSGRPYIILTNSMVFNVHDDQGNCYCFGPTNVPHYDVFLAQKIALETMEHKVLHIANSRRAGFPPPPSMWCS
jgi:hypothetical protein